MKQREIVQDIWFRTELEVEQVAVVLGLRNPSHDHENRWEWIIGDFRLDHGGFGPRSIARIAAKIEPIAVGPVEHGVWADPGEA